MKLLVQIIKLIWIILLVSCITFILSFPVAISAVLSSTGNVAFNFCKLWGWIILKMTRVHTTIRNQDKIEKGRSYIVISNHQSLYDIPAIIAQIGIQLRWIIKKELLKIPFFGYALYAARNIFVDRSNRKTSIKNIQNGMKRLPGGVSLICFAEGTRSDDGKIGKFKKGGFIAALEKHLPILPVTVNGSRNIMKKGSLIFNPGSIEVVVGDPIDTHGYSMENITELMDKTRDTIISNYNPEYPEK